MKKKKSNLPFAHFGLQYRFERFLAIGRLWLHTSATNACTHCTAPASAATALSAYSSYCCSTQKDSTYIICITQGELLQQQHTSTTHATSAYTAQALSTTAHVNNTCNISLHSISTDCNSTSQQHKQHLHIRHQYLQQQHKSTVHGASAYTAPTPRQQHTSTTHAASEYTVPAPTAAEHLNNNNTRSICIHGTIGYQGYLTRCSTSTLSQGTHSNRN